MKCSSLIFHNTNQTILFKSELYLLQKTFSWETICSCLHFLAFLKTLECTKTNILFTVKIFKRFLLKTHRGLHSKHLQPILKPLYNTNVPCHFFTSLFAFSTVIGLITFNIPERAKNNALIKMNLLNTDSRSIINQGFHLWMCIQ